VARWHRISVVALAAAGAAAITPGCQSKPHPLADVTADEHGFHPSSIKLPAGGPGSHMSVSFLRTTDRTCATEAVFPELRIEQKLPLDQVVSVDLPTDEAKTLTFQCGMGMYKGAVVVTRR